MRWYGKAGKTDSVGMGMGGGWEELMRGNSIDS